MLMKTTSTYPTQKRELYMLQNLAELNLSKVHPAVERFLFECIEYLEGKNDGKDLQDIFDDAGSYADDTRLSRMFFNAIMQALRNQETSFLVSLSYCRTQL